MTEEYGFVAYEGHARFFSINSCTHSSESQIPWQGLSVVFEKARGLREQVE